MKTSRAYIYLFLWLVVLALCLPADSRADICHQRYQQGIKLGFTEQEAVNAAIHCRQYLEKKRRIKRQALGLERIGSPNEYTDVRVEKWTDKSELEILNRD